MKPEDIKLEYVRMRAEGQSYSSISKALGMSKSTCSKWEKQLAADIARCKQEKLNALYDTYMMGKEARVKRLGQTLNDIEAALEECDLSGVPPEKLLDLKLKYSDALKKEYTGEAMPPPDFSDGVTPKAIGAAFADLFLRVRSGEITVEQARLESGILADMLRAHEAIELKEQLDCLSNIRSA